MAFSNVAKVAVASAGTALLAFTLPYFTGLPSPGSSILSFVPEFPMSHCPLSSSQSPVAAPFICETPAYRTEIVSLDPLVIYIHSFLRPADMAALLDIAGPRFAPSQVTKRGRKQDTSDRTSSSAGLPRDEPAVQCVLGRARGFLGAMMRDGVDDMGPPQLVRYARGQKFNVHHDWYEAPQWAYDGSDRKFNRVATFFAILQDDCTDGETHFPYIRPAVLDKRQKQGNKSSGDGHDQEVVLGRRERTDPVWREHEEGGLAFRPIKGNALFWVNLHANGTGDQRTMHAGLPVGDGLKTAMNIWPRRYY